MLGIIWINLFNFVKLSAEEACWHFFRASMGDSRRSQNPISVAVITKNEEERLPDCLRSASFADEVVVVDSGSEDKTLEVAESFGARTIVEPWRGYSGQKQFAVDRCAHDWVLILE